MCLGRGSIRGLSRGVVRKSEPGVDGSCIYFYGGKVNGMAGGGEGYYYERREER
jgi:hypothetical protein